MNSLEEDEEYARTKRLRRIEEEEEDSSRTRRAIRGKDARALRLREREEDAQELERIEVTRLLTSQFSFIRKKSETRPPLNQTLQWRLTLYLLCLHSLNLLPNQ